MMEKTLIRSHNRQSAPGSIGYLGNERGSKDWWIQAIHPESNIKYLFWTSKSPGLL